MFANLKALPIQDVHLPLATEYETGKSVMNASYTKSIRLLTFSFHFFRPSLVICVPCDDTLYICHVFFALMKLLPLVLMLFFIMRRILWPDLISCQMFFLFTVVRQFPGNVSDCASLVIGAYETHSRDKKVWCLRDPLKGDRKSTRLNSSHRL